MSIIIKGMEMPKSCLYCPMLNGSDECCLLPDEQNCAYDDIDQVKDNYCPLVELPENHGRLIDADAFVENVEKYRIPHEIASDVELKLRADMLTEEEREQAKQEEKTAYNKGLTDAWEAARKMCRPVKHGGMTPNTLIEIFGTPCTGEIIIKNTATEAITKIKAYEDKQQKIEQEIKVGDEVIEIDEEDDIPGIVTGVFSPFGGTGICYILWLDGSTDSMKSTELKKTGRHFPQVEKLLKAANEE